MPEHRRPTPTSSASSRTGRDRLFRSLVRPTRRQLIVALLLALVGFAGVTQVRANEVDDSYASLREQDLIDVLNGLAGARQRAEAERDRLAETRDDLTSTTSRTQAAIEQADERGRHPEHPGRPGAGDRQRDPGHHQEVDGQISLGSMLDVIQELRTVGAEAIQINGEVQGRGRRPRSRTSSAGSWSTAQLMSPPYVIDVIGEPNVLAGAMTFIDGPKRQVEEDGGTLVVDELSSLDIEAVRRPVQPEYAEPDLGQ